MTNETKIDRVIELRSGGLSYSLIGKLMSLNRNQVAGILHRAGGKKDPGKRHHARSDKLPSVALKNASLREMSEATGVPISTLKDWRLGR